MMTLGGGGGTTLKTWKADDLGLARRNVLSYASSEMMKAILQAVPFR